MEPERRRWYFLPNPLLGPSSWRAVADELTDGGDVCLIADPPMTTTADDDHVTPWLRHVVSPPVPTDGLPVVVVAHSGACLRAPMAVRWLLDAGWPVSAMICVDGRFPDGTAFTEHRPEFAHMLDGMVRPDDYLPPWPRWWGSLVEGLVVDPAARDQVFAEAPPIPRRWFDQACPVPELPPSVGRAFLCFGPGYLESGERANREGWLSYRLAGDHLHQVVAPGPVAATLMGMVRCLATEA
ncbi:MAG: hypothetical protein R2761_21250 [Acidimicrobiales bacterium]